MKLRPERGSSPWIAIRKRRPHPAIARSGHEADIALTMASTISFEGWLVHSVTGRPGSAQTMVPCLATSLSGRNAPAFFGISASIKQAKAITTAACMLACEEFTKLVDWGSDSDRSISILLPDLVTFAAIRISLR